MQRKKRLGSIPNFSTINFIYQFNTKNTMKKLLKTFAVLALLCAGCKDDNNDTPQVSSEAPADQMHLTPAPASSSSSPIVLALASKDETALTFTWSEAADRGSGLTLKYRFELTNEDGSKTLEKGTTDADAQARSISFTHKQLNDLLTDTWGLAHSTPLTLKAVVAAEVQNPPKQMSPEVSNATVVVTCYAVPRSIGGDLLRETEDDAKLLYLDKSLSKDQSLAVEGFEDFADWKVNPDFFEAGDNTLKFLPIAGTYRIFADLAHKYFTAWVMTGTQKAVLQNDGSGAVWVYGAGIGNPFVDAAVEWNPNTPVCFAPIGNGKHQLSGIVGERFKVVGSDWGLKLAISGTGDWDDAIRSPITAITDPNLIRTKYTNPFVNSYIKIDDGDNIHPLYDGAIMGGRSVTLILDASNGLQNIGLTIEGDALISPPANFNVTVNGTAMEMVDPVSYKVELDITQGSTLNLGGADAAELTTWWIDPDFIDISTGAPVFKPISGKYRITAYPLYKYFKFDVMRDNDLGTLQANGGPNWSNSSIWVIGSYIGKPSWISKDVNWNPVNGLCMAPLGNGKFQITFEAGDNDGQIKRNYATNFKFFGQPAWGVEFAGIPQPTAPEKGIITTTSEYFMIVDGGDVIRPGSATPDDPSDDEPLPAGTYVITVDLSGGFMNAVLNVEKK
jgi:hypothetical protein